MSVFTMTTRAADQKEAQQVRCWETRKKHRNSDAERKKQRNSGKERSTAYFMENRSEFGIHIS